MTEETLNEKIKKLVTKVNSIQGSLLSMGKRLTALEEKKESTYTPDDAFLNFLKGYLFGGQTPWILEEKEKEQLEAIAEPDPIIDIEEIDPEVLDSLDEIIEG